MWDDRHAIQFTCKPSKVLLLWRASLNYCSHHRNTLQLIIASYVFINASFEWPLPHHATSSPWVSCFSVLWSTVHHFQRAPWLHGLCTICGIFHHVCMIFICPPTVICNTMPDSLRYGLSPMTQSHISAIFSHCCLGALATARLQEQQAWHRNFWSELGGSGQQDIPAPQMKTFKCNRKAYR